MPALHCGMFVGRVVVHDQMKLLVIRSGIVNEAQELNPFLMPVSIQAHADHLAVGGIESSEQGRCAIAFVVVSHCPSPAFFERQTGLSPIQSLDLTLLIAA